MISPLQIYKEKKKRKQLEMIIRDEENINKLSKEKLVHLYEKYLLRYGKEYGKWKKQH